MVSQDDAGVEQCPTGIDALDTILGGGIPRGHVVLVAGDSGTGKTMLSMEWLFRGYKEHDESGLYLTLTEAVTEASSNLQSLDFFSEDLMGDSKVSFADLRSTVKLLGLEEETTLDREAVDKIVDAIEELIEDTGADRLVIDSITALAYLLESKDLIRTCIFRLGTMLSNKDVTTILTSEVAGGEGYSVYGVEEFIADGIIKLDQNPVMNDLRRSLQVVKMRGIAYDSARRYFEITSGGINLFLNDVGVDYDWEDEPITSGIPGFDDLVAGGLKQGTTTMITGPAGAGKTLSCLHFIREGLEKGQNCLYISFEEHEEQLLSMAEGFGWELDQYLDKELWFLCKRPAAAYPEQHMDTIQGMVEDHDIDRVVLDSLSAIRSSFDDEDIMTFARNLSLLFSRRGAAGMVTSSHHEMIGSNQLTGTMISTMVDNIVVLNTFEARGELKYSMSIIKTRSTDHDKSLRSYSIDANGLTVGGEMQAYEGVMTGSATKIGKTTEERLKQEFVRALGPMGKQEFKNMKEDGISESRIREYIDSLQDRDMLTDEQAEEFRDRALAVVGDEAVIDDKQAEANNEGGGFFG